MCVMHCDDWFCVGTRTCSEAEDLIHMSESSCGNCYSCTRTYGVEWMTVAYDVSL